MSDLLFQFITNCVTHNSCSISSHWTDEWISEWTQWSSRISLDLAIVIMLYAMPRHHSYEILFPSLLGSPHFQSGCTALPPTWLYICIFLNLETPSLLLFGRVALWAAILGFLASELRQWWNHLPAASLAVAATWNSAHSITQQLLISSFRTEQNDSTFNWLIM
jgi:hypothetical protein